MSVTFLDAGTTGVPDLVEVWESTDFIAETSFSSDADVILADSSRSLGSTVQRDFLQDGTELVVIREAHLTVENVMVVVQLSTTPSNLDIAMASAQADVQLDGEPALGFFSIDEVTEAVGA
ncbi:MAG: hypothetical protein WKF63_02915 [Thermomicrobiales bacterium]